MTTRHDSSPPNGFSIALSPQHAHEPGLRIAPGLEHPLATCHCGAVCIALASPPSEITACNCSLCASYGALWAYYTAEDILVAAGGHTETYACNGQRVDFHRCKVCGCLTHWVPRDPRRGRRGINARLLPRQWLEHARLRRRDGANGGEYLD